MKTWIFLSLAALSAVCTGQHDCRRGACYPAMGDLLLGREQSLRSSSTCGLMGSEVVCTPHGQWKMKCCPCDSRNPAAYNAHTIQNVISSAGPNRWWQSKKDVSPVALQLDLNGMYHLETVLLSFKGPRPDALIVERTRDFGRSWQPVLYMATNCPSTFPQVSNSFPRTLEETYCYTLPSTTDDPYRDQKIHFYPLRQFADIDLPNEYKIEVASGFTGVRINLTQLGSVPSMPGRSLNQFYALREMRVIGSCFCHGHANRCNDLPNTQVGGVCECQHNTAGVNCERCDDLHNDLPWRPAENGNTHTCKRCECNNHADRCHFDEQRYEATGRRSGGVCDDCTHHTAGPNCEHCANNYYRNPLSDIRSPDAYIKCIASELCLFKHSCRSQLNGLTEDLASQPRDGDIDRSLDDLQALLSSLRLEYFTKRDAFTNTAGSNNASTFYAIQKSYEKSTDAVKRADTAKDTLKKSEGLRENALSDLRDVQPGNTRDLEKLKKDLATRPNLTLTANKVCGGDRVDSCTPERCAGDLCPPDGAPPCGAEEPCAGALPNANKAFQDADEVKAKLQDLNNKITQAAAQIQEAEDSANRVRLSTDELANQIKQVQADMDEDLKDTKDFINNLRDFLSEPHSDPDEVQRVCEAVLDAQVPLSVEKLKQKLKELQDLASSLPDSSRVLENSREQLENARQLLEEANNTRDAAFGIQQDAESILKTMDDNEDIFDELEDKIRQSVDIANNVKNDVKQIEDALLPAEQGIVGVTGLLDEMRPLLDDLRKDVTTGTTHANEAQDQADSAQGEAEQAAEELEALKKEFERLKRAAAESTEAGEDSTHLQVLQKEAESLMTDTSDIMQALKDKEASVRQGSAELQQNAARLTGLDDQVKKLRDDIRYKVTSLSICQG
ncbi:laminin subunit beta-3 [Sinocyclocheilus anshuiensis]|uniref:laminin subunit beta-3 n=1 Tax=Sinocyclocheilus anshuiensis TaxID=1608454 RepID=UPI0007B8107A|nr:PREDICTED: laminin subunit beta-3 [Sinocyclocheilus anshuiensis]